MSRRLVVAGVIRAGRVTLAGMHEPIEIRGSVDDIAAALAGARTAYGLGEVEFADYVDRLVALAGPALVYGDGSFTRA